MIDVSLRKPPRLMTQTAPFIGCRMVSCFRIALARMMVTGTRARRGRFGGASGDNDFRTGSFRGGALGFVATAGVIDLARKFKCHIARAGHIAVYVPDPAWDARIERGYDRFCQIGHRTAVWTTPTTGAMGTRLQDRPAP